MTLTISCLPLTAKLNALLAGTPCSTFASDALAAGVGIHALARIMGTSVRMIERSYGILLDGALESIAGRLDALDRERDDEAEEGLGH